jgi:hypothetical protein
MPTRGTHRIGTDAPIDGECGVVRIVCDYHAAMAKKQGWSVRTYNGPWDCVFCALSERSNRTEHLESLADAKERPDGAPSHNA